MSNSTETAAQSAGTRFPFITLKKALDQAKKLFDADQKGREMPIVGAFQVWEYSDKSSGGFQTVAALKMYGLLQDADGNGGRKVALTDSALRYFRDERESEKLKLAQQFALKPKLIASLWATWHASPPADAIARSHLKAERGLTDQGARSLLSVYKENLAFAKLKGDDKEAEPVSENGEEDDAPPKPIVADVGDLVQVVIGGALQLEQPTRVRAVQDHEGQQWAFIDGTLTGFPMEQVQVIEAGGPEPPKVPPVAPILPLPTSPAVAAAVGEREWLRGPLSKGASYRLIVNGDLGPKEIGKLIKLLEAQKSVLADDDDSGV